MKRMVRKLLGAGLLILAAGRVMAAEPEEEVEQADILPPEKVEFHYSILGDSDTIVSNEKIELTMTSKDAESEVQFIHYRISDGNEGDLDGGKVTLVLEPDFQGTVEAYAVDQAGNQSESSFSKEIICETAAPEIAVTMHGNAEGWNLQSVPVSVDVADSGISSGLQSIKCYVNHEVVVNCQPEFKERVTSWKHEFVVETCSFAGMGVPVVIETLDYAGNFQTVNRLVYIDKAAPQMEMTGGYDRMIAGEPVQMAITAKDENLLEIGKLTVWRTPPKETKVLYTEQSQNDAEILRENESGDGFIWNLTLEEDGIYEVETVVQDAAGHEQILYHTLTIDRTNPVIRFIEQMQGAYLPYFQWNYDVHEMIEDFTEYHYQMTLNGTMYTSGTYVEEEGTKILQVNVTDAAGNCSTADAVFYVDHTPPEIKTYHLEDGGIYKERVELNLEVGEPGAYLEEVFINSEKINLTEDSRIFCQTLEEPGEYRVKAQAKDLAGNRTELELRFQVEKKGLAATLIKPVKKLMDGSLRQEKRNKEMSREKTETQGNTTWFFIWCLVGIVICLAVIAGITVIGWRFMKRYIKKDS